MLEPAGEALVRWIAQQRRRPAPVGHKYRWLLKCHLCSAHLHLTDVLSQLLGHTPVKVFKCTSSVKEIESATLESSFVDFVKIVQPSAPRTPRHVAQSDDFTTSPYVHIHSSLKHTMIDLA